METLGNSLSIDFSAFLGSLNGFFTKLNISREGVTAVEEPFDCPNVSRISSEYASIFQEFLQNSSLPIWNRFKNIGFWRQLTVGVVKLRVCLKFFFVLQVSLSFQVPDAQYTVDMHLISNIVSPITEYAVS